MKLEEKLERLEILEKRYNKQKEYVTQYQQDHQEYRLFHSCKGNAKKKGIHFELTVEDIVIPKHCPLLEVELTNIFGEGRVFSNASVDRIDHTKGYTRDNIQVISDLANRMKQNATNEQLITFAKNILRTHAGVTNHKTSPC